MAMQPMTRGFRLPTGLFAKALNTDGHRVPTVLPLQPLWAAYRKFFVVGHASTARMPYYKNLFGATWVQAMLFYLTVRKILIGKAKGAEQVMPLQYLLHFITVWQQNPVADRIRWARQDFLPDSSSGKGDKATCFFDL